jgi:hypothetical protein
LRIAYAGSTEVPMTGRLASAAVLAGLLIPFAVEAQQLPTAPRLRGGAPAPLAPPLLVGGGEVVLDVTVAPGGAIAEVQPVRSTPPYTALVAESVRGWVFEGATRPVEGVMQPTAAHVLVLAVFRPPQVYAAPAPGEPTQVVSEVSAELPSPGALAMPPSYPPTATRDGSVLIEIELTMAGMARGHRVLSQKSPFDAAALDTVRGWRFEIPRKPLGAPLIYAYAIVGFREPITGR